ncbi:nucleoside hydrolase [Paenibacillus sp. TRM 82003]|uniref:nucleoside hydrolase n=1 Tax=Kineococcus sp. TRM81007 TaxID=2925831 RepID=UPI001F576846|nr:nucleoside hydrolase [Kineococcus sp. TRM81007]MCI2238744.1 nucleoside hydrolase [Kineococcus sp. TRM81007]MCI3924151.1 nucleoside hydrolase [Paenibacillus sp. TRM 82003]
MPKTLTVARRSRVVVDNDWAGDPDGLVALAHHLLSPGNVVEAVTSSLLSPLFGPPAGGSARGAALAAELVDVVGGPAPAVHAGSDEPFDPARPPSEAATAIVRAARRQDPLPLVVVCAGPLTNVAEALHHDPRIAERMTLSWVGGSSTGRPEYNRDTDEAAAAHVLGVPGLRRWQFPLETYRTCAWSVAQLEDVLDGCGPLGAWLWRRFVELPLPDGFEVDAVWPLGDSCPLVGTALSPESSTWLDEPDGTRTCTRLDGQLVFGDMVALFRGHARRAAPARPH